MSIKNNIEFSHLYDNVLNQHISTVLSIKSDDVLLGKMSYFSELVVKAMLSGNRVFFAGNGGSAADAQHLAAEFVSRFYFDRPGLPALALSTDTSMMTAISNDYGYEQIFRRQLEAQGKIGDIFVGITTSGKSKNILEALKVCSCISIQSVVLCGTDNPELDRLADLCIRVPSSNTPRIQECHIIFGHMMCEYVERSVFINK
jgi:D-sedoheptulose 7-phosphate isomerase